MMFKDKHIHKLYAFALAAVFALVLAGCGGGGGGSAAAPPDEPPPMPTPEERCTADGGRYNADGSCTSAADLEAERVAAEAAALTAAKNAAAAAAMAANTALDAAKATLTGIADIQDSDPLHYSLAEGALDDARRAKQAADAANAKAQAADNSGDAEMYQAQAEAEQAKAEAAMTLAAGFAQEVKDAKAEADRLVQEELDRQEQERIAQENAMKISDAQEAARLASVAASEAASAAATALETLQGDADATAHQLVTATTAKIAADAAAQDAADAYAAAMGADTVEAAESARDDAQMAQMVAEAQQGIIDGFNMANQDDRDDDEVENQRMADVAAARSAAMQSYMDADADATKADEVATAAETAAPGSPGAMAAREAATAARNAADAAKAAHDAIMDDMTKDQAEAERDKAATAAGNANDSYMTAKRNNDAVQTAKLAGEEQQRVRDIADAKDAAEDAMDAAKTASDAAGDAADDAETAMDNAKAALDRARAARTDSTTAEAEYEKAKDAATAARNAADEADTAYMAAKAAHDGIDDDGEASDAEDAQETAETKQREAETAQGTADTQKTAAETAEYAAETAAGTHVLGLLKGANAVGVMDNPATDANEQAAAVMAVATAIGNAAGAPSGTTPEDADNNSATTGATVSDSGVTATWPADGFNPDGSVNNDAEDNPIPGMLSITVTRTSGSNLVFRTEAAEEDDATTTDVDETVVTATDIGGLGDFMHGYSISDRGTHAIVFTDKQQGTPAVAEVVAITAQTLVNNSGGTVTDLGTRSGTGFTGVTYYASGVTVGDDTDMALAFTGTLTCPASATTGCTATENADGTITIEGYTFTGSRAARAAVTAVSAAENNDYLAFGVWLQEDSDAGTEGNQPAFAAFFGGGSPTAAASFNVAITGTATYEGSATGVYTEGTKVDYFEGDATLTANFGTAPEDGSADTVTGTITGMIDNIVAGGVSMSDVIHLNDGAGGNNISAEGGFSGDARMGERTVEIVDSVATVTYPYNGLWRGSFYNGNTDDTATADVDESLVAPGSVAGSFGVTGTDDMGTADDDTDDVTRSYVGAFGAHKQ